MLVVLSLRSAPRGILAAGDTHMGADTRTSRCTSARMLLLEAFALTSTPSQLLYRLGAIFMKREIVRAEQ